MNTLILSALYTRIGSGVGTWLGEVVPRLKQRTNLCLATWTNEGGLKKFESRIGVPITLLEGLGKGYAPSVGALKSFIQLVMHQDIVYFVLSHVQAITGTPVVGGYHVASNVFDEYLLPKVKSPSGY
jgi:hypothetical protein